MSAIKQCFDAVAARKYQKRDGTDATQWINIGRAVEWEDGGIEVELTSVPVRNWWNGKFKLFVPKDRQQSAPAPAPAPKPHAVATFVDDSEIPF